MLKKLNVIINEYLRALITTPKNHKKNTMNQGNPNGNTAEFFNNAISHEDFARNMRNFMHAALMLNFQNPDNAYNLEIESGYFWLTKFCEQIDPVLTKAENQKAHSLMKINK